MPALQDQPYPSHPAAQVPWLWAQLQRQHRHLAALLQAMPEREATKFATWDILARRVRDLRDMAAELEGLNAS